MFTKNELNQLYRYAVSLTRHDASAYDLVQSAVERYLTKSAISESIVKPTAYMKTIIRNLYFDHERHNKVIPMVSLEDEQVAYIEPVDNDTLEDVLISQQEIRELISDLNAYENELLYLWAVEQHTVEEIAAIYQKPKGTNCRHYTG